MAEKRFLSKAPIKEALIDIQVVLSNDVTIDNLDKLADEIKNEYPKKEDLARGNFNIHVDESQKISTSAEHNRIGIRLTSSDGLQIVQFRLNGFTFSRLEPYESWNQMEQEAKRLCNIYFDVVKPIEINRVATRFINVMRIPMVGFVDFDTVLTAAPQIPEKLPQGLSSFLTRVVIPYVDIKAAAIVTQAFEAKDGQTVPITLDIDVFSVQRFSPKEAEHWDVLNKLKEIKNDIFFESITDKTLELF
ncbi:MAG: TIGR04255 family protein [Gammaproteobacteria bacterium]|nr:TIGR04255 family protein [Gammaproteobacteria bacterium]